MKLIGLTGLPRSGKDSVAKHLIEKHGYTRMAFADPLKYASAVLLNRSYAEMNGDIGDREVVMPEWGFTIRHFLRYMGTEGVRQFDKDFWIKRWRLEVEALVAVNPDVKIVVTDVRFDNEGGAIRELGGHLVQVLRPGITGSTHASDAGVTMTESDSHLQNYGSLADLYDAVDHMWRVYRW